MAVGTALVTDGNQRKALAATRSLGAAGWRVIVAEDTAWQMARFSRHAAGYRVSPPAAEAARYAAWLVQAVRETGADLVLPMDDGSTAAAVATAGHLGDRVLVPTAAQWAVARDKAQVLALARAAGVPAPPGAPARSLAEAEATARAVGYPVVVRARCQSGGRGLAFVQGPEGLAAAFRRIQPRDPAPLVQRQVGPGTLWDVCLLYDRQGRCRAAFVQRELRHFPLRGGTSTLQESAWRPDLVALAQRLLAPLGWCGPVEVEFLEDRAGQVWLMEVNPRFWASLALAIDCGVDFPCWLAALARGKDLPPAPGVCPLPDPAPGGGAPPAPVQPLPYPVGRRCRWLLPGDLLHYLANPERARMDPPFWCTYDWRTRDDIWRPDDPWPALGFVAAALRLALKPSAWRMLFRW